MARTRLDQLLVERGLVESREKAQALVLAGLVTVEGIAAQKAGQFVDPEVRVQLARREPYVGRGGYKLAHALDSFGISCEGLAVVDVGASTGGFTDVLLQRGARRVFAVDVGRGQLHWRLRSDPRVVVLDQTNARYLTELPEQPQLATIDVSFISLRLIVPPVHRLLAPGSSMIALVKPQFEAGRELVRRGGVVRSRAVHRRVLEDFVAWLSEYGPGLGGLVASPIRGPAGNAEFLAWIVSQSFALPAPERLIEAALDEVHPSDKQEEKGL